MLNFLPLIFSLLILTTGWKIYITMKNKELLSLSLSNSDLEGNPDTDLRSNQYDATSTVTHRIILYSKYMEEEAIYSALRSSWNS